MLFRSPGAIQYYGPDEVCNQPTQTLMLERGKPKAAAKAAAKAPAKPDSKTAVKKTAVKKTAKPAAKK